MKIAVYPGSFDPITNGHIDILKRSLEVFDEIIVLIAINPDKKSRIDVNTRLQMIREATKDLKGVTVDYWEGLTVEYAKAHGAKSLVRGLREVTDFKYELNIANINEKIDPSIDMVFFMSRGKTNHLTSSMVMDLYNKGEDISPYVPESVTRLLK